MDVAVRTAGKIVAFREILPAGVAAFLYHISRIFALIRINGTFSVVPLCVQVLCAHDPTQSVHGVLCGIGILKITSSETLDSGLSSRYESEQAAVQKSRIAIETISYIFSSFQMLNGCINTECEDTGRNQIVALAATYSHHGVHTFTGRPEVYVLGRE